jgi:hypothetical protein
MTPFHLFPADPWLRFVLAVLATWRITHLLALEDGPWDIVARVRMRLGQGFWGRLLDCFYCLSIWVAAATVVYLQPPLREWPLWWLACSGGACLLERLGPQPQAVQMPLMPMSPVHLPPVERLEEAEAHEHGMLRTASSEQQSADDERPTRSS